VLVEEPKKQVKIVNKNVAPPMTEQDHTYLKNALSSLDLRNDAKQTNLDSELITSVLEVKPWHLANEPRRSVAVTKIPEINFELSEALNKIAVRVNNLLVNDEITNNKKVKPQEQNEYY